MAETDVVIPERKITEETIIDVPAFLSFAKSWLKKHSFYVMESEFDDFKKETGRDMKVKYASSRTIDEYTIYQIISVFKITKQKPVVVESKGKKQKKTQCNVEIKIITKIQSDYLAQWEGKGPLLKFLRGVYDNLVAGDRKAKLERELKEISDDFYNEMKAYLSLQKI